MTTFDRIVEYTFTAVLVVITSVAIWRHQSKPEPGESAEKKQGEP